MNSLVPYVWAAGAVQLGIVAANFFLPAKLRYRENYSKVSPILRQISLVHWIYIVAVLLIFTGLCFFFAPQLAGGSPLGRYLSATLAVFWLSRCAVQLFYYERELRRHNRIFDTPFLLAFFYLGAVFAAATIGGRS
jgi:hypothetical protein